MTDPLATAQDVADLWRPLSDAETPRVERLIDKASAKLRQACPFDIDARIELFATDPTQLNALDPAIVSDRVALIVKRFLANPEGAASVSKSAGPFAQSTSFVNRYDKSGTDVRGELRVTDEDIDELRPAVHAPIPFTVHTPPRRPEQMRSHARLPIDAYRVTDCL